MFGTSAHKQHSCTWPHRCASRGGGGQRVVEPRPFPSLNPCARPYGAQAPGGHSPARGRLRASWRTTLVIAKLHETTHLPRAHIQEESPPDPKQHLIFLSEPDQLSVQTSHSMPLQSQKECNTCKNRTAIGDSACATTLHTLHDFRAMLP